MGVPLCKVLHRNFLSWELWGGALLLSQLFCIIPWIFAFQTGYFKGYKLRHSLFQVANLLRVQVPLPSFLSFVVEVCCTKRPSTMASMHPKPLLAFSARYPPPQQSWKWGQVVFQGPLSTSMIVHCSRKFHGECQYIKNNT